MVNSRGLSILVSEAESDSSEELNGTVELDLIEDESEFNFSLDDCGKESLFSDDIIEEELLAEESFENTVVESGFWAKTWMPKKINIKDNIILILFKIRYFLLK